MAGACSITVQSEQDGGVEHADAARQAGGEARGVGGDVDAEEDRECQGDVGALAGGQQRVEDRGGDRHIAGGERHLQQCHAQAGQVDLVAEQPEPGDDARQRSHRSQRRPTARCRPCAAWRPAGWSPKNGTDRGSSSRIAPPSTRPPNMNVTLQNAAMRAICPGVMPQWA